MKIKGAYEGIPGFWLDDSQSPDGKRWIATQYGWERIQARMRSESKGICELGLSAACPGRTPWLDVHHRRGRGAGKRDDRVWVAGQRNLLAVCRPCHGIAKIERKGEIYDTAANDSKQSDGPRVLGRKCGTADKVPG